MKKKDMWEEFQESSEENNSVNNSVNNSESSRDNAQDVHKASNRKNDWEDDWGEEPKPPRKKVRTKKTLTGSTFAKIFTFFLMTISFVAGAAALIATIYMFQEGIYEYGNSSRGKEEVAYELMFHDAIGDARNFYLERWPEEQQELEELLDEYCEDKNIQMEVWKLGFGVDEEEQCILSNYEGYDTPYIYERGFTEYEIIEREVSADEENEAQEAVDVVSGGNASVNILGTAAGVATVYTEPSEYQEEIEVFYTIKVYINPELPIYDEYAAAYEQANMVWEFRYVYPTVAFGCILLWVICFIFLMCAAGHKNGKEGIAPSVLTVIHFDVLTLVFVVVASLGIGAGLEIAYNFDTFSTLIFIILVLALEVIWCTIYCMEVALRLKMGKWWKHTLIYVLLHFIGRIIRFLWRTVVTMIKGLPLIINTVIIYLAVCIVEFLGLLIWGSGELAIVWFLEKIVLFAVVIYIALVCKKLQEGSAALAEGNMNHKLDTSKMLLDFKEHGENLNQIGQGISKAVEERMKSEHMKTELITNVSHDIKTPLTSIINYADLLGHEAGKEEQLDKEKVAEYSEVLLRQSKRMKKLLEDLVEASKATTGNLEVNMEKCQVGVLLSQAVGEYEQRFWEKHLELITRQPEEPVWVMADGRRLWRVFDNLLNNICKYAQENTRVYVTVEKKEPSVEIIFRNMSKYPLELTGEELEERFVRGDKSRHMEGNGLGLSIAKSLVDLQKGSLEIVTDGDLFKVILKFPVVK